MNIAAQASLRQANSARHYELPAESLPWRCPMPDAAPWNSHPRVFLRPDEHGKARCPYCSAEFVAKG